MVEYLGTQIKVTPYKVVCLNYHETLLYLPEDKELLEFTKQKCSTSNCDQSLHWYIINKTGGPHLRLLNDEKMRKAEEEKIKIAKAEEERLLKIEAKRKKDHEDGIAKAEELRRKAQLVQEKTSKEEEAAKLDAERKEALRKSNALKKKIAILKKEAEGDADLLAQLAALEEKAEEGKGANP